MSVLRLILGDQLSRSISSLKGCNKSNDLIMMCEVWNEATYVKHHKKKIAFLFSAMRHFASELEKSGYRVVYTKLDDKENTGSFKGEVERRLKYNKIDRVIVTHPGEYRVLEDIKSWEDFFNIPVKIVTDDRFLCQPDEFAVWAQDHKQPRMEYFYRELRKKYSILMENNKPVGGSWNYDLENRKFPKSDLTIPNPYQSKIDGITQEVIMLVAERFSDHFGDLEPFYFAVTRKQALYALQLFIDRVPPVSLRVNFSREILS